MIVPSQKSKNALAEAASAYQKQLWDDEEAQTYLAGRGLTKEVAHQFGLGVVRDPLPGHDAFLNRISFPYYTATGITTIRFRLIGDAREKGLAKFLCISGDTPRIYNVLSLMKGGRVYVCEGETDTLTASMAGLDAIGIPGATAWKPPFSRILRHREVVVLADNDDSGEGAKFADIVLRAVDSGEKILMPKGHDVSSFTRQFGFQALRERIGLHNEA